MSLYDISRWVSPEVYPTTDFYNKTTHFKLYCTYTALHLSLATIPLTCTREMLLKRNRSYVDSAERLCRGRRPISEERIFAPLEKISFPTSCTYVSCISFVFFITIFWIRINVSQIFSSMRNFIHRTRKLNISHGKLIFFCRCSCDNNYKVLYLGEGKIFGSFFSTLRVE